MSGFLGGVRKACLLQYANTQQIREAVLQLGEDADRQYAPRPAEVRVYLRNRSVPAEEVAAEQKRVLAEKVHEGVDVAERVF